MQNYRKTPMPYNHYKPMASSPCTVKHDAWNDKSLAMAYVPWQTWRDIYEVERALERGTIFCELDKPFLGKGGMKR